VTLSRRAAGPLLLLVVLGAALLIGSGVFDTPGPAAATRIAGLERLVRCPTCQDLSLAQATDSATIALRRQIAAEVHRGESNTAILNALIARYGTSILLEPPAGGLDDVLWIVPVVLAIGALGGALFVLARRRRAA
jgi:cytochrome c-type biogenesis protein CcmH